LGKLNAEWIEGSTWEDVVKLGNADISEIKQPANDDRPIKYPERRGLKRERYPEDRPSSF
jgi:hypothetical protein